ncbi:MAG: hypothetical protein MSK39_03225 [Dysosmobacter sp.]|nr:hypothetical protein [Dysosmobacter sp.]
MKQGPSSPALSDQEIIRAWKWKRRAIYPCVAVGVVLLIAGFLLRENDTGMPLLVAGAIFGIAARELNTACRRCPRCGHLNAPAQGILHGFTCTRCGYTISDT